MTTSADALGEQLTLTGLPAPRARRPQAATAVEPAPLLPVARVAIDLPPAHLDRLFEYVVPAALDDVARPGTRVKVRFGRQDVDGYLIDRAATAEHSGPLAPLRKVVSGEVVLIAEVRRLARAVADRYAGTLADVLRLAVPPRHARVEGEDHPRVDGEEQAPGPRSSLTPSGTAWEDYRGGGAFLAHLTAGHAPRAVWSALPGGPGHGWADAIAQVVVATVIGGRGALVVVPDARDVDQVAAALETAGLPAWVPGGGGFARLTADEGPAQRYRSFLAVLRGDACVAIGTRAAVWAPVAALGLVV